jgi:hypothetical protein
MYGVTKEIPLKNNCNCEKDICLQCAGCGFAVPGMDFKPCMGCVGDGFIQNCVNKCTKTVQFEPYPNSEIIHPDIGIIKIQIEKPYFIKDSKVHCYFDISLKESLTGFNKIFKDPFGKIHNVNVKDNIIKTNDGYQLDCEIILVFKVIYPKKLNQNVIEQLKSLNF